VRRNLTIKARLNGVTRRRSALRAAFATGAVVAGAAGTRSLDRYTNAYAPVSATDTLNLDRQRKRRYVSSVGPVHSKDSLFGYGTAWDAYEYIDTELHYFGTSLGDRARCSDKD
jgi:hypothetical protein